MVTIPSLAEGGMYTLFRLKDVLLWLASRIEFVELLANDSLELLNARGAAELEA